MLRIILNETLDSYYSRPSSKYKHETVTNNQPPTHTVLSVHFDHMSI